MLGLIFPAALSGVPLPVQADDTSTVEEHTRWVGEALQRMLTIQPGMTRRDLLTVFQQEGGISTREWQTYASRDCPYFKVDFTFREAGDLRRDKDGRYIVAEDERDIVVATSQPYVQFSVTD